MIPGFRHDFGRQRTIGGNKILGAAFFWYEAAKRRSPRRLSRIAKGPLTRCSELALARIAKGGGLIDGHRSNIIAFEGTNRGDRNTGIDSPTRDGGTLHRYRNRCVANDHGTLRRAAGRSRSTKPGHCARATTRKAAFDHQRHYPGSSARQPVCRILARRRNSAPALNFKSLSAAAQNSFGP